MAKHNNTTILQIGKISQPAFAVSTKIEGLVDVVLLASSLPDDEDLCDIFDRAGHQLWCAIIFADVPRAIKLFRDEHKPGWMNGLMVKPWDKTVRPAKLPKMPLGLSEGLPIAARDGLTPMLTFTGSNLMMGDPVESISVACGAWSASITIELTLRHLDDFVDAHRARLVELLGFYFGVELERQVRTGAAT